MAEGMRQPSTLILVTRDGLGDGGPELRHRLAATYFRLLDESGTLPGAVAFYAEGVKLAAEGSPALDSLAALERKGVHMILCKTCVDHYGLADKVRVGVIGGMTDIVAAQWAADKVVAV